MNTRITKHDWTNLGVFDQPTAGKRLQKFVEEAGFEARIHDERRLQRFWFLSRPRGAIKVQVPGASADVVRRYLEAAPGAQALLDQAILCPACESARVHYPQMSRKSLLPTLVAQLARLFGVIDVEFYCEDCHHTWVQPRGGAKRPRPTPSPVHQ